MGPGDGFTAADRHGVKHAGRLARIVAERIEERRVVPGADAAEDVEMQLQIVLAVIEDTQAGTEIMAGDVLDRLVRDQEDIEFRANLADQTAEFRAVIVRVEVTDAIIVEPG